MTFCQVLSLSSLDIKGHKNWSSLLGCWGGGVRVLEPQNGQTQLRQKICDKKACPFFSKFYLQIMAILDNHTSLFANLRGPNYGKYSILGEFSRELFQNWGGHPRYLGKPLCKEGPSRRTHLPTNLYGDPPPQVSLNRSLDIKVPKNWFSLSTLE